MKLAKIFFLCIVLHFGAKGVVSPAVTDTAFNSLKGKLKEAPFEMHARIYNDFSNFNLRNDSQKSYAYADSAFRLAVKYHDTLEILASLKNMAEALYILDKYEEAIESYKHATALAKLKGKDTLVAKLIFNQGIAYYNMNAFFEAEVKLLEAEKLFTSFNLQKDLAETSYFLGGVFSDQGNYPEALKWYYHSLDLAGSIQNEKLKANIYNSIGIVYQDLGSYEKALKNYTDLLHIAQKINDRQSISYAFNNIGIVYYDWGKKEKALEYYQKSQQIDVELGNRIDIAGYYNNVGIIYDDWGQSDLAIGYYTQALEIYKEFNDLEGIATAKNNIGESLAGEGKFKLAQLYLQESLAIEKKLGSPYGIASSYHTIGEVYFNNGNLEKAIAYNSKCLRIADSIGMAQLQMVAYELNYKVYEQSGNNKKALAFYQKFEQKKDSIYDDRFHQRITDLQIEKELEKQEQLRGQIHKELLNKERSISVQRIYLFIILLLMLVFGGLVYYDFRMKNKANQKLTEMNATLLANQNELSKTLEDLTKSESKFRYLVENSPNGILYLNTNGKIIEANKKFLDILYVEDVEAMKKVNALDFKPLSDVGIANDLHKCIAEKKTIYNEGFFENQFGQNIFLKFLVFPVMSSKQEVVSLIVHVEDMTPVLLANKKRKELEGMYRMLVENSLQAMLIVQDMKVIFANSKMEKLSHYSFEDLKKKGRRWIDLLIHPDDFKRAANNIRKALGGKENQAKYQYKIIRHDGEVRWMETLTSVVDFKNKPAMLIVAIDITERLHAEKDLLQSESRLRELNSMKDKFFSIIAHDLKNPFSSILGFSNLLNEAYDNFTDKQRKEFIKNICVSSENTFKLLQNLLEWSRTQTGNIDYHPDFISLDKIIGEVQKLMIVAFKNKEIELIKSIPQNMQVFADRNMVRVVVRNLLSNALKFTNHNGRVEIAASENDSQMKVWVKDSGVGISQKDQQQIFRIDNQIKTKGTDDESGSGLGLLLCKEFIEKNGGELTVESKLGEGSIFSFYLPKSKPV